MKLIFCGNAGENYFSTSDIGWVVGHSYIVYGPLIAGMGTIMYEGTPIRPDGGIWWSIVEKYKVTSMFSSPTAIRVLKKQDPALLKKYDLSSLRLLFLAGEPLDEPTGRWIADGIGKPVIDNFWQTETGWPILAIPRGVEALPSKFGSPGLPCYGYNVKILNEATGEEITAHHEKGVVAIEGPLPPGCMTTVWGDDERFVKTYWTSIPNRQVYSTFDWGIRDEDGYFFILGRTDDVINVAGHRLGTREIEESLSSHPNVAEVAVVGVADQLKGQVAIGIRDPEGPEQGRHAGEETGARGRTDEGRRRPAWRGRPARARSLRQQPAEDALRQAAAPVDPGPVRGTRPGRPDHDRGPDRPRSDPGGGAQLAAASRRGRGLA